MTVTNIATVDLLQTTITTIGSGGGGGVGSTYAGYLPGYGAIPAVINSPNTYSISNTQYQPNIQITGANPTILTDKNKISLDELAEMMKIMRERLLIIVPDFEKHEKYEALKKAYDHYKLIEAMVTGSENGR